VPKPLNASHSWPDIDLVMTNTSWGLRVSQHGREYVARNWQITGKVVTVVDAAIRVGLHCLWGHGHPQDRYFAGGDRYDKGSAHLSFSASHDTPWFFVLGWEARPPEIHWITVNKKHQDLLDTAGITYEKQISGGKHLWVKPAERDQVLGLAGKV